MTYKMVHVPEPDEPDTRGGQHSCKPANELDYNRRGIRAKHGSIAQCQECGQYWWANVYGKYNSYGGRTMYHLEWYKLRWYQFKLRKYVK